MKFLKRLNHEVASKFLNAFPQPKAGRVDQKLTTISLAVTNETYIHDKILPVVGNLKDDSGEIGTHDNEHLRVYESKRAVFDEDQHRIEYGLGDPKKYEIDYHDLVQYLPDRIQEQYRAPFNARRDTQLKLEESRNIQQEDAIASVLSDTSILTQNVTLSGTDKWSDFANSDPIADFEFGAETIRLKNGRRPNSLVLGATVVSILKQHPDIINRITGLTMSLNEDQLIKILKDTLKLKKVLIGEAIKLTSEKGQTNTKGDIWEDIAVLYYAPEKASLMTPSFGYRFELSGKNKRIVIRREFKADKGDLVELGWAFQDKLLDVTNAYLIKDVLA